MKLTCNLVSLAFLCVLMAHSHPLPCGVGAEIMIVDHPEGDLLQIVGVASNSPAARAGLAEDQVIRAVDGVPTIGLKYKDCVKRIQGVAGTKVVLKIEDSLHGWTNSVEVTREVVADDPLAFDTATMVEVPEAKKNKALSVNANEVIRVSRTNGAIAYLQFTQVGLTNANYRWRFRPAPGGTVSTGAGVVFEDYDRRTNSFGSIELTHRGSPDDLKVKAGDFRLEWSSSNLTNGWLYYYPAKEKLEVLDSSAFDSDLK